MTNKLPSILSLLCLLHLSPAQAQVDNARQVAPFDITGNWVSIVNEEWRYRMLTAPRGDTEGMPLTELGERVAQEWDPQADLRNGEACRAYGAAGIMRQPTRLQISWQGDNSLRIDADAGTQTRLLKFGPAQDGSGMGTWQGVSNADWHLRRDGNNGPVLSGTMEVETYGMRPGYLRRNGVPYSDQASMQEYFDIIVGGDGTEYLVVVSVVEDPVFLLEPALTSSNFRREADASKWMPGECLVE